jgi:predicted HAD superfamily Cof-like phosphohydrolase
MSYAQQVHEFTSEASSEPLPESPQEMNLHQIDFIMKMVIEEIYEIYATLITPQMATTRMKNTLQDCKKMELQTYANTEAGKTRRIADQSDGFIDILYYVLNALCKNGVNGDPLFQLVHEANMAKRDPTTLRFMKREDGKILKPLGWVEPNIVAEIARQMKEGAWPRQARQAEKQEEQVADNKAADLTN